jgi:hypothetical protein
MSIYAHIHIYLHIKGGVISNKKKIVSAEISNDEVNLIDCQGMDKRSKEYRTSTKENEKYKTKIKEDIILKEKLKKNSKKNILNKLKKRNLGKDLKKMTKVEEFLFDQDHNDNEINETHGLSRSEGTDEEQPSISLIKQLQKNLESSIKGRR